MSFREKSAWLMAICLALVGIAYAAVVATMSTAMGQLVPPLIPLVVVFTLALAILATGSHILIALFAPKDAVAPADERDRTISARAGTWSGYVFATGIALALGQYLIGRNGDLLFYCVFGSWMLAQLSEYAFEIALYRRGI
jgi:hypothetical protein